MGGAAWERAGEISFVGVIGMCVPPFSTVKSAGCSQPRLVWDNVTQGQRGGEGSIKAPFCQPPHWTFFTLRPQTAMHKGNAASLQDIGAYLDSALNNAHPNKPLLG